VRVISGERVEVDDLFERRFAAGVEVRAREFDIAQTRRLEESAHPLRHLGALASGFGEGMAEAVGSAQTAVVLDGLDARVEKPSIRDERRIGRASVDATVAG